MTMKQGKKDNGNKEKNGGFENFFFRKKNEIKGLVKFQDWEQAWPPNLSKKVSQSWSVVSMARETTNMNASIFYKKVDIHPGYDRSDGRARSDR